MSEFQASQCATPTLDPHKRVRYSTGLVLGVDEFRQEQTYFLESDRTHNRGLHGYGTVHGLRIHVQGSGDDLEVRVEPGMAIDPHGRRICVNPAQCAKLNLWLDAHADDVLGAIGSPPDQVHLDVVLCYRECQTDRVPIPAGPCLSAEGSMAASRTADDFELKFVFRPERRLPHIEERGIRALGRLLRELEVTDVAEQFLTLDELLDLVRRLSQLPESLASLPEELPPDDLLPDTSPPDASLPGDGSLPAGLAVHPSDAAEFFREAWRVWVTETRPKLMGKGRCVAAASHDDCVLLGELQFEIEQVGGQLRVVENGTPIGVDQRNRPILLTTRTLQELLASHVRVTHGDGGVADHGLLAGLLDDDHPLYLLADGGRALTGDLSAGTHRITNLGPATDDADAVRRDLAVLRDEDLPAASDLSGKYRAPVVKGLQTRPIADAAPAPDQFLGWNDAAGQWEPRNVAGGTTGPAGGDLAGNYPNPRVAGLQGRPLGNAQPRRGQTVMWNDRAGQWQPQDAVRAQAGEYAIVAAGAFDGTQSPTAQLVPFKNAAIYNKLRATIEQNVFVALQFPDYDGSVLPRRMYIVKVTPIRSDSPPPLFEVVSFEQDRILGQFRNANGSQLPPQRLVFMVEISAYGDLSNSLP